MKIFGAVGVSLLFLLLGSGIALHAQDQHDDARPQAEDKAKQDEVRHGEAKPEEKRDNEVRQDEKKDENVRHEEEKDHPVKEQDAQHDRRVETHEEHVRISDKEFHDHFGHAHTFRIGHPVIVEGRPRFTYSGHSFIIVDPWPVGWAYTDAVYVDFIDGAYYLIDPVHPGIRLSLNIVL